MSSVIVAIGQLTRFNRHNVDDFCDRLNRRYTVFLVTICAIICGCMTYFGDPIECWVPAHFTGAHSRYAEKACWTQNTFSRLSDNEHPFDPPVAKSYYMNYYQWTPFVLLTMAFFFYVPHIFWSCYNSRGSGVDIFEVASTANDMEYVSASDVREKSTQFLVKHLDRYFSCKHVYDIGSIFGLLQWIINKVLLRRMFGNLMIFCYLSVKIVFVINATVQFYHVNSLLGNEIYNETQGFERISDVVNGSIDWTEPEVFPRNIMCDFDIERMGGLASIHRYTVQCGLPINILNEKLFIVLWFWLLLVTIVSFLSIFPWILTMLPPVRVQYVKKYLKMANVNLNMEREMVKTFAEDYIGQDGSFVLRLVSKSANDNVISDIVVGLWQHFRKNQEFAYAGTEEQALTAV